MSAANDHALSDNLTFTATYEGRVAPFSIPVLLLRIAKVSPCFRVLCRAEGSVNCCCACCRVRRELNFSLLFRQLRHVCEHGHTSSFHSFADSSAFSTNSINSPTLCLWLSSSCAYLHTSGYKSSNVVVESCIANLCINTGNVPQDDSNKVFAVHSRSTDKVPTQEGIDGNCVTALRWAPLFGHVGHLEGSPQPPKGMPWQKCGNPHDVNVEGVAAACNEEPLTTRSHSARRPLCTSCPDDPFVPCSHASFFPSSNKQPVLVTNSGLTAGRLVHFSRTPRRLFLTLCRVP